MKREVGLPFAFHVHSTEKGRTLGNGSVTRSNIELVWLVAITFTASWHKIFDLNPRVGFLEQARVLASAPATSTTARLIFNNRLDAAVTGFLLAMVTLVLIESARQWVGVISGRKEARVKETPFVMTRLTEERA